jgi:choline dehydrogenase-like flavoprotein
MSADGELDTDVVVIGAGVAGALVAAKLAADGVKVTIVEAGPTVDREAAVELFRRSVTKAPEVPYPSMAYAPRPTVVAPDAYYVQQGPDSFGSTYERRVGGTTWHWLGTALRLIPDDFQLKTRYGVGVDWPISYDDLEPWYGRAEDEIGVAGIDSPTLGAPRTTPYPMPPIPPSLVDDAVRAGAGKIGLQVASTPQARNSVQRQGRPACCGNASCIPICPIGAKYDGTVHVKLAEKAGAKLLAKSVVDRVEVEPDRVVVHYLTPIADRGTVTARTVVFAAHAVETPKLLLMSKLGNDHVGRYLMDHPLQLSVALAPDSVEPHRGPLSTSGIEQLRTGAFRSRRAAFRIEIGNDGWDFPIGVPPAQALMAAQKGPLGAAGLKALGEKLVRQLRFAALIEPLPEADNRVTLSDKRDEIGIPRPAIAYRYDEYIQRGRAAARKVHGQIFSAMGASDVQHIEAVYGAGHLMGTCRMGDDPRTSVVDAQLRLHGHGNAFVLGSSTFPSVGTANPTLTIAALSLRAVEPIKRSLSGG